ncbi:hypothetical protein CU098_010438 [Rhizopus stolonifer]|uniref:Uncharacterized protein n=1 Tax=Rhizopus stolonifer TaxID=4846 RepID=A0A367KAX7_RHIST|nr:hypothetical protein CU098_010438 [Rhizopus stolonifer]
MYSPRRTRADDYEGIPKTPERTIASPLRAIASPLFEAVKHYKDTATRDFDRFYGNLQATLSPRTSESRIRKRTLDTQDRIRSIQRQKKSDNHDRTRTSLTPLIERHSLREDARAKYDYPSRNPFYQDNESDIAETPSLVEYDIEDSPNTHIYQPTKDSLPNRRMSSHRLQRQLLEERHRMDRLQKNLARIKRQSSFLADEISSTMSIDDSYQGIDEDVSIRSPLKRKKEDEEEEEVFSNSFKHRISLFSQKEAQPSTSRHPHSVSVKSNTNQQLATPPQSIDYYHKNTPSSLSRKTSASRLHVSPKRNVIDEISTAKLRSTETISTPGGSRVSNRFWREIHGLNARREIHSPGIANGRISKPTPKRISTFQEGDKRKETSVSQTWANDDGFWSAESNNAPAPSALNSKLLEVAEQEKSHSPSPIRNAVKNNLFEDQNQLTMESASSPSDDATVHSLYKNPLFKAAQQQTTSLLDELESAKKRDEEIRKRNNIPAMNNNLLAELKAKHRAKFIDDSDSYKFS